VNKFAVLPLKRKGEAIDLSMTNTSSTPVVSAAQWGVESIPDDFILDEHGNKTTDPKEYIPESFLSGPIQPFYQVRGSLFPLGGSPTGHKGYALLFAVNVLATVLSDTDYPWDMLEGSVDFGCQFIVVDPSAFVPIDRFKERVDEFIRHMRTSPRRSDADAEILYPGERSQALQRKAIQRGSVWIPSPHFDALVAIGAELGIGDVLTPNGSSA